MKTKTALSKITALLLSLVIVVGMTPLTAFAAPAAEGVPLGTSGGVKYTSLGNGNASVSGYDSTLPADLTLPSTVEFSGETYTITEIGDDVFQGCTSLENVIIPNSVTSIGNYVFNGCGSMTSVTIGDSVQSIGDWAFSGCASLENVIFPNSVTSIGNHMFNGCGSMTSVTIGDSVQSIGDWAFSGCSNLVAIYLAIGNTYYTIADDVLYNSDKTTLIWYPIGKPDTSFSIPNSVQTIGGGAFVFCANLSNVVIPDSVQTIGSWAFQGCTGLTSVTIPNSVQIIDVAAFYGCTSLTSVTIPNSVQIIDAAAFYGCTSLTNVSIGDSVTSIGELAFYDCTGLTTVSFNSVIPPTLGNSLFVGCPITTINVTIGSEAAYKAAFPSHAAMIVGSIVAPPASEKTITLQTDGNGTATVSKASAQAGEVITLTATPNNGYRFKEWQVVSGGVSVVNNQFTMPANNIVIKAVFEVGTTPPVNPPTTSGGSSSGSGGGSSRADGARPTTTTTTNRPLTKAEATKLFETALAAKPEGATTLSIKVQNKTSVTKEVLAELAALAKKNGVTLTVHFDNVVGGKVVSRLSVNPATATADLDLNITENKVLAARFAKYYSNPLAAFTVKTGCSVAIKLPANLTAEGLVIYSYDAATNTYAVIPNAKPWVDKSGYLHFDIVAGTEVVISQGELVKK